MAEEKKGFFKRLVSGLTKTRDNIVKGFDSLFSGWEILGSMPLQLFLKI